MKNLPIFADKIRFWPFKVLSQKTARAYLVRKSGTVVQPFSFRNDLSQSRKKLFVLPQTLSRLSIYIPFLLELAETASPNDTVFLCPLSFQPLLKALDLERFGIFMDMESLRYGNPDFRVLDETLLSRQFEAAVMLEPAPSLLLQYLIRSCRAPVRVGFDCESYYPFLNLSFRGGPTVSTFREQLNGLFRIKPTNRKHPLAHHSGHLSSQHVILLNLEPALNGKAWTQEELNQLARSLDPRFRLLALAPDPKLIEPYAALLERLAIRIAPIASSFSGFLDLLRQYRGLVSLNSEHVQLAMHVSQIPTILVNDAELSAWNPENCPDVHVVPRKLPYPEDIFRILTQASAR